MADRLAMMRPQRSAPGIALVVFLAVIAIPLNAPTRWEDEAIAQNANPQGGPLVYLLSDSAAVALFHEMGFWWASGTTQALIDLTGNVMDQGESPLVSYLASQGRHTYGLIYRGTRNPIGVDYDEAIFRDEPTILWGYENAQLKKRWADRLNEKRDTSSETKRLIDRDIAENEHRGFRRFMGSAYEARAQYYLLTGDDEQAIRSLEEARACHMEGGNVAGLSHIMGRIGDFYLGKGDLSAAEQAFVESYDDARFMEDPYYLSRSLAFLSKLRAEQGHFADAESLLVRSLVYARRLRTPSIELSRLADLASLYESLREHEQASLFIEKAISIWTQIPPHPANRRDVLIRRNSDQSFARCLAIKARIESVRGDPEAAVETMKESLAAAKGTADRTFEADLTKGLGDACAAAGHDEEALRCYSKACANARKRHERAKEAQYLTATGELYLARRDYGRAEVFLEEAAGIACTDGLWQERVEALHSLARARTGLGDYGGSQKLLEESISALERGLADKRFFENRQPLNERVRAIFADLLVLESARGPQCDSLLFTAEKARQFRAGAKGIRHKDLDASIKLCLARRDWIPEGALIIQCVVTPERLIIAGMDRLRMECRSISVSVDSLNRDVDSFVAACGTATHASTHAESPGAGGDIEMRARSLYRLLVEPLGSLVSGKETLCFICDEPLHRVPFGALVRPGGGAHFLLEDTRVVSSPDLLTLYAAARKGRSPESGTHPAFTLLVGRPDIGSCLTRNYPGLETLPNAQDELFEIRDAIGRATILAGPLATKEAVVQRMPSADRIHIATHRVSYPAYSGRGALLFSAADECDVAHAVETSLLTESEIGGLDLSKVDLVVLSACQSATDEGQASSERMGLAGAFLEAGARTVIATLWPIEDKTARGFMAAFYRELVITKEDPCTALQEVQRKIIRGNRLSGSPTKDIQAWAPYLVIGPL